MADLPRRIVLIGFAGAGKSTVAARLAGRLGWQAIDTDTLIEQSAGRSVAAIFAADGEARFRALEREAIVQAAALPNAVIATGGGAFMDADSRRALADGGLVVALEARLDTIAARQAEAAIGRPDIRPLLDGAEPSGRIRALKAARQPFYALADVTIHTDVASVEDVVDEIVAAMNRRLPALLQSAARLHSIVEGPGVPSTAPPDFGPDVATTVTTPGGRYPVYVGWGLHRRLGEKLTAVAAPGRAFLITDEAVARRYAAPVSAALEGAGRQVALFAIPPGEESKSLAQLERLYHWLAAQRAERGDTVIALGGGVVGDLAGAAAATYLRGMALVHVPTTLLAMVDAAIGGKVAIDLPSGKNLVGAFHQPLAVVSDVATLASLPPRELAAGWAEVIKHAFIRDPELLEELERDGDALASLAAGPDGRARAVRLVARNAAIKGAVVSADERESQLRLILNYGHTIGHALEAVTAYGRFRHGEAVAVGLMGAAEIARRVGLIDAALVERHRALLERFGLPVLAPGVEPGALLSAIQGDKKVAGGRVRWVLLEGVGVPVIRQDVPPAIVEDVVAGLTTTTIASGRAGG